MANHQRWMEPQSAREGQTEWLFQRFYNLEPVGLLNFNVITLCREEAGNWVQSVQGTQLRPLLSAELQAVVLKAGFESISCYGDLPSFRGR